MEQPINNSFNTYTNKYITTLADMKTALAKYGVAVIPGVLTHAEYDRMINDAWNYLETVSSKWTTPINRNDKSTWREFSNLCALHSMLIQHHGIGHSELCWNVRQHPKVAEVFATLWNVNANDLLSSFDGASLHLQPEVTNRGGFNNLWLHTDQSYTRNSFECVQSWITALDVEAGDATLAVLEGSHLHHATIAKHFNITDKSDWYKLNDIEIQKYNDLGCTLNRILCPAGSIVLWDSRTIHCGQESMHGRTNPKMRCVVYVCMLPRSLITSAQLRKKQKAYNEKRMTTHHPTVIHLFPVSPRTYGKQLPEMTYPAMPELTDLGKRLAGL